ncbi:MAG: argininosuccinate synthase [Candidatus Bathyarchaeota archaeon]|nr:MAG: argininosuccinate synthase [Candidatus Bathyarchaeota archaeon]
MVVSNFSGKTVVTAYSGGLDSTLIAVLLKERYGFSKVVPVLVDVGQGDEEIKIAEERADILGLDLVSIDAKQEFARDYIFRCIKSNGTYNEYPLGTSMTRVLITAHAVKVAEEVGAEAFAHGCTGKGNDQYRMEATAKYLAPELIVVAPVRELDLTRAKEEEMLRQYGVEPTKRTTSLGGDVNMWSHSMGSGQVEDLHSQYPKDYLWITAPEDAPNKPTTVKLLYEQGVPVDADGIKDPVDIILHLNKVGGENGVGRIDVLEDGIIGLKSRELYEAPAAKILIKAHSDLEHLTLTKEQLRLKHEIDRLWADLVYHGGWFHPFRRDLDAFIDSTQRFANGEVTLNIYKGNMDITERKSHSSLFAPELRSIKKGGFDQRTAIGAVKLFTIPFELYGEKGR